MHDIKKLVIASNNQGKLSEIGALFAPLAIEVLPQSTFNINGVDEPYHTFIENALVKARHASRCSGLPALADDSGICVNALKGAPGVISARYAGEPKSDKRNNLKLIKVLKDQSDRSAYYYCIMILVRHAEDPQPMIADGIWHGEIVLHPRGESGFGYDPYFFLPGSGKTAAELSSDQKNLISHRGKALTRLIENFR
ncbi:RdgB/HAM1 family non-canonical purine NTP pyrophosphatase [Nitrosomonas cryotolerans]|nr:RdgB/HAM1 family non-canonical purine NTP pyrophosphatase [Nitrosomonas cryotolerans]